MLGLETSLAVTLTELVEPGHLSLADALALPLLAARRDRPPRRPRRTDRARRRRPTSDRVRPRATMGRRTRCGWRVKRAQHAVRRPHAHRARCVTRCCAANRSSSTARPAMTATASRDQCAWSVRRGHDALLVLADGSEFEGEAIGASGRRLAVTDGRAGVQHRAVGLPGDRHRPVVRGTGDHVHLSAHRQLRRQRRRRREPSPVLLRVWWCATSHATTATGAPAARLDDLLVRARRARHQRDRHPPPHPSPARRGRAAGRVRHRRGRGARRGRGRALAPTASTSSPPSPPTSPTSRAATTRRSASSPTTSASSARSCGTSSVRVAA